MIYTFYSYKGGVGRTMALANVAELFLRQGRRVLMIDWDLEAPGLEQFFFQGKDLETCRAQPGIMELLAEYKAKMTRRLDLSNEDRWPFTNPFEYAQPIERASAKGQLWLLTSGRRSPDSLKEYARSVLNFDWQDFYDTWAGGAYIDWLRRQCKQFADVMLIDSRTGVTEMGGVCTYHLADVVALFCAASNQNIQGTEVMVNNLAQPHLHDLRGGRPLKTLIVPARIDMNATEQRAELRNRLSALRAQSRLAEDLQIPYISPYAFEERIAVTQNADSDLHSPELIKAYEGLAERLDQLGGEVHQAWERKRDDLKRQLEGLSGKSSELLAARVLETDRDKKQQIRVEMELVEQKRRAIEDQLKRLQREFQYYLR